MRCQKDKLHPADEIGRCHHDEGGIAESREGGRSGRQGIGIIGRQSERSFLVDSTGYPGGRQDQDGDHDEPDKTGSPVIG